MFLPICIKIFDKSMCIYHIIVIYWFRTFLNFKRFIVFYVKITYP